MSSFFRVRQSGATVTKWSEEELQSGKIGELYEEVLATDVGAGLDAKTEYNNRPGTGITGTDIHMEHVALLYTCLWRCR